MANLIYRTSDSATIPPATVVKNSPLTNLEVDGNFRSIKEDLASKAPSNNPTFTGIPTAPTAPLGTDTGQVATTAFVQDAVEAIDVPVTSVAGKTGDVTLTKADVGLSNVDNTSDAEKSVLSATKLTTARTISLTGDATGSVSFDGSANASMAVTVQDNSHAHTIANVTGLQTALDAKASTGSNNSFSGTQTFTRIKETVTTVSGTAPSLGAGNGTIFTWSLTGASTPTSGLANGESCTVLITPSTHSINWANFNVGMAGAPLLTNGKVTTVVLYRVGATSFVDFVRQH